VEYVCLNTLALCFSAVRHLSWILAALSFILESDILLQPPLYALDTCLNPSSRMAQPTISFEMPHEVARIDDLADREQPACLPDSNASSRRSSGSRILPDKPKPGALKLLFAQDVAGDWWLESQLLFGESPHPLFHGHSLTRISMSSPDLSVLMHSPSIFTSKRQQQSHHQSLPFWSATIADTIFNR
jgi:hypothetical protein